MAYCEKFRPQLPANYNHSRQFEKPIPSLRPPVVDDDASADNQAQNEEANINAVFFDEQNIEHFDDSMNINTSNTNGTATENGRAVDDNLLQNESQIINESTIVNAQDANQSVNANEGATADEEQNLAQNVETVNPETKFILQTVQMDAADELAIASLLQPSAVELLGAIVLEENETADVKGDKVIITKRIDTDCEMIYTYGETPNPLAEHYKTKINDLISGNIPFKENVRKTHDVLHC